MIIRPGSPWTPAERWTLLAGLGLTTAAVICTRLTQDPLWLKVWDNFHWTASYAAAALLVWLAAWRAEGSLRRTRRWFALALTSLLGGQLLWDLQVAIGWNPFPGPSDALFASMGPLLGVGVLSLARGQSRTRRLAATLDGVGLGLCMLALTLATYLPQRGDFDAFTMAVLAAYPTALLSVAALLVVVSLTIREPPSAAGLVFFCGVLGQGLLWMKWNELTLENGLGDAKLINYLFSYDMLLLAAGIASFQPAAREVEGVLARAYHLSSRLLPLTLVVVASVAAALSASAQPAVQSAVTSCMAGVILVAVLRQSLLLEEGERLLRAEARSRALEERMTQSQRLESLGTLASGIAHDINNVLTAILGHAELLSRAPSLDHAALGSVEGIRAGASRARDVVRRVLTFSRQEPAPTKPFDVRELTQEVVALLRAALPARHDLRVEIEGRPRVLGNPAQVHQVLMNLGTNASQAIGERPGKITFGVRTLDEPNAGGELATQRCVELVVSDDGDGMDATTQARIFDPFFTTKRRDQGTGLGLSVVHGIVSEHRGTIQVESKPGQGARFRVLLPAATGAAEPEPEPEQLSGPHAASPSVKGDVLVVDDEEVIGLLLVRLLKELGHSARATTSPERAIELFRSAPDQFAFVVTDMSMPTMSGTDLALALRGVRPDLRVVLSSGTDFVLSGTPFDDVLPKPYSMGALRELVERQREGAVLPK